MLKIDRFDLTCVCGGRTYFQLYKLNNPFPFQILKCNKCGLVRTCPVPRESYDGYLSDDSPKQRTLQRKRAEETMDKIEKWISANKTLLDVGCGRGCLIEAAVKRDWKAFGVDINSEAVKHVKMLSAAEEANILNTDLFGAQFPSNYFEAVDIGHTFEHLPNLIEVLREIKRILKQKGILVISVPNYTGLIVKLRPGSWYGWQPKQHIWHFSPQTLESLVVQAGFAVLELKITEMQHEYNFSLKGLLKGAILCLSRLMGQGDNMYVIARKM